MSEVDFFTPALRRLRRVVKADTGVAKLSPSEDLRLEMVARLAARLDQLRVELDEQPLIVPGSRSQPRPNPLVAMEAKLVAELDKVLAQLVRDVGNRAMLDEARALTAFAD